MFEIHVESEDGIFYRSSLPFSNQFYSPSILLEVPFSFFFFFPCFLLLGWSLDLCVQELNNITEDRFTVSFQNIPLRFPLLSSTQFDTFRPSGRLRPWQGLCRGGGRDGVQSLSSYPWELGLTTIQIKFVLYIRREKGTR